MEHDRAERRDVVGRDADRSRARLVVAGAAAAPRLRPVVLGRRDRAQHSLRGRHAQHSRTARLQGPDPGHLHAQHRRSRTVLERLSHAVENLHRGPAEGHVPRRLHLRVRLGLVTHTHTHPLNGPFPETAQVSRYQKGKTNLDFTEARDSEWQWHQLGHMQVCTSLQTDNHASTPPPSFYSFFCK